MSWIADVKIDAGDVCEVSGILVSLVKEVSAIVVAGSWTAWVFIEHKVSVLIGLGSSTCNRLRRKIIQKSKRRNNARRVLKWICTLSYFLQREPGSDDVRGVTRTCISR